MADFSLTSLASELKASSDTPCRDLVKNLGQGSRSLDSFFSLSDNDSDQPEVGGHNPENFDLGLSEHVDIQMEWPPESRPAAIMAGHREATEGAPGPAWHAHTSSPTTPPL